ncbi:MAG TPA: hypothetical protein VHJ38_18125 [Nitrososphaeraceae archaeon]|jgi:hypothetical protein|nr:hypothetical protein [Nitrososphaeraceae archaeon]
MNLSSNSFWADINFGTATGSLSNNIKYNNKPKQYSIYFINLVIEWKREKLAVFLLLKYYMDLLYIIK